MAIMRHEPGALAPADGTYALVGHYGEATNFAVSCQKGERLPLVVVAGDFGPLWFVRIAEEALTRVAA
jgi:hypothetical protein